MREEDEEPEFKCWGQPKRAKIVQEYELTPVDHLPVGEGQVFKSATGKELTDSYYIFSYRRKGKESAPEKFFICGKVAGKHFLELLGLPPMPVFNFLLSEPGQTSRVGARQAGDTSPSSHNSYYTERKWNDCTKELLTAIRLLLADLKQSPRDKLSKLIIKLNRYHDRPPYKDQIENVNRILGIYSLTMSGIIANLEKRGRVRKFSFENLKRIMGEGSNFE